ncbi:MAG: hypothetical protein IPJ74_26315 [Saprospiraceae bacterium]|nr:hypothetical protein [Saprospiraceae bacterium]
MREVFLFIEGARADQTFTYRTAWETVRWQTAALLQVHVKKGRSIKPTDLIKFDWEEVKTPSLKPNEKTLEKWAKWDEEMKNRYGK